MKKTTAKHPRPRTKKPEDEILPEYDFSGARRNPYAVRFNAGAKAVVLDPDVAEVFTDGAAVNETLRALVKVMADQQRRRSSSTPA